MRKFNNTIEIVTFTFQVALTAVFIAGFATVLIMLVTGNVKDCSFGMIG